MQKYNSLIFRSFSFSEESGRIELNYSLDDDIHFSEVLTLPMKGLKEVEPELLNKALFALHLIGGISYYKTCCPKKLIIESGELNDRQAEFWNTVYQNGLGEFFYQNKIDFRGLINFPVHTDKKNEAVYRNRVRPENVLVPMGGGKDSIVTMELLRKIGKDITLWRIGQHPVIDDIAVLSELPLITIQRELPPELIKLNNQGALNGHIPITAYNSFVSVVCAILYEFDAIAFSNERSANIGSTEFHGQEINHQWSKSLEYEKLMQQYIKDFIVNDVDYFSLLRPLSELAITREFTGYPEYLSCSTSCNTNWRIVRGRPEERWCRECPKCAFVYALLAGFLEREVMTEVFGSDLYDDATLVSLYKELLGLEGIKPFECVGTPEETTVAMLLAKEKGEYEDTPVMEMFTNDVLPNLKNTERMREEVLAASKHAIPDDFLPALHAYFGPKR